MTPVLSVASEAHPLVKTGGLADVVGALPEALAPHGFMLTTLLPGYPAVTAAIGDADVVHEWRELLGVPARLLEAEVAGQPYLILDAPDLFARSGGIYAGPDGRDWPDNWRRFAALSRAAADLAGGAVENRPFALLHAHDWQAALAPVYVRFGGAPVPSVTTVHNIAFQGRFERAIFPKLGLPAMAWALDGVEYFGGVGFLKGGLVSADAITTVSPTYAEELLRPEFGMGLEGLIAARSDRLHGIVNGIDHATWDPSADPALAATYSARTVKRRVANKRAVEEAFGLEREDGPLFCVVSRLTGQKGMDLLAAVLDGLVGQGGRLALLGSGAPELEQAFRAGAARYPGRVAAKIGYDEALSHLLQGGADAILIPSRFEPCGLTQLYGLAYGCVPVVARTGGLADTVIDANQAAVAAGVATGVVMDEVSEGGLLRAIARTIALHARPDAWRSLQKRGMRGDWSWTESGRRYATLYQGLLAQR